MSSLISNTNFKLHWISMVISQLGSFCTIIALPWMVLHLSDNDALVMTSVMATTSLPLSLFMLVGGVLTDKTSPLTVLIAVRFSLLVVLSSLAVLVYLKLMPIWLVYIYALVLGTLAGVVKPAGQSLLPLMLSNNVLGKANGIVMGTNQLSIIFGPIVAGWLIWLGRELFETSNGTDALMGFAFAYAVDAFAVLVALAIILFVRIENRPYALSNVDRMFINGLKYCWYDRGIRFVLIYMLITSFFVHGPLYAMLPLYAKFTLGLTEKGYGILYAMIGVGTLTGAALAYWKSSQIKNIALTVLFCDLLSGVCLIFLGQQTYIVVAALLLVFMSCSGGIIMVVGATWFQVRTEKAYIGRVMSILMFTLMGMVPVSSIVAGSLYTLSSVSFVFLISGLLIVLFSLLGMAIPTVRTMGDLPPIAEKKLNRLDQVTDSSVSGIESA